MGGLEVQRIAGADDRRGFRVRDPVLSAPLALPLLAERNGAVSPPVVDAVFAAARWILLAMLAWSLSRIRHM